MKLWAPERFEDFEHGDMDYWFNAALDEFESHTFGLVEEQATPEELAAMSQSFEKIMLAAAQAGIESRRAWEVAARHSTLPRKRYCYFARAYELQLEEAKAPPYDSVESILWDHYHLADYADEMARIHEADGELQKAAEWYERALRHVRDAADAADARTQFPEKGPPRRLVLDGSLERIRKLSQ